MDWDFFVCFGAAFWTMSLSFSIGAAENSAATEESPGGVDPERNGAVAHVASSIQSNLENFRVSGAR